MTDRPGSLLELRHVSVEFASTSLLGRRSNLVTAMSGISLAIGRGEIVALIGASGSGKTTLVRTALGLQVPDSGEVLFDGRSVNALAGADLRAWRRRVQLIFQDPSEALNPRMTVEQIMLEGLQIHRMGDAAERRHRIAEALDFVGLTPPEQFFRRHPHTLSGGQRQRVAIAASLVLEPELLVADEPVSMLDPSIRAGILDLFGRLRDERGMSTLMVTHDLPSAAQLAERVLVMNRGHLVEQGRADDVFAAPAHDYTRALIVAAMGTPPDAEPL